jgi:hypothetical protein
MGLDNYASNSSEEMTLTPEQAQAFEAADIQLCGGLFSGAGGSFRGKIYAPLIAEITGVSLYQEWIPPTTVRKMYQKLSAVDPEAYIRENNGWEGQKLDILDLRAFFKVCAERNLGLIGWW